MVLSPSFSFSVLFVRVDEETEVFLVSLYEVKLSRRWISPSLKAASFPMMEEAILSYTLKLDSSDGRRRSLVLSWHSSATTCEFANFKQEFYSFRRFEFSVELF